MQQHGDHYLKHVYTKRELEDCSTATGVDPERLAARFAAKEAVGKALGFGVARAFAWRDVEIAGRPKPAVRLSGRVRAWPERAGAGAIDLSMSHSRELATAVAVVE